MSALLRLPRVWWLAIALPVVVAAVGVTVALTGNSSPSTNVLGEKITGSGSSSGSASNPNSGGNGRASNNGGGSPGHGFTISGSIDDLYPGIDGKLYLTVDNPNNQAITVQSLSASLQSVTGPASCAATTANITIQDYVGPSFDVDKNSSKLSVGYIPVTLPANTANACQGVTYNLRYSGTAVQK